MSVFDQPLVRPVAVALAVLAGGMTLSASAVVALVVPASALAWLVLVAQVTGAVLLVVGGLRVAVGRGPSTLVAGAVVQVAVCVVYVAYGQLAVDEAAGAALFTGTAVVFAVLPAASAYLATRD